MHILPRKLLTPAERCFQPGTGLGPAQLLPVSLIPVPQGAGVFLVALKERFYCTRTVLQGRAQRDAGVQQLWI